MKFREKKLLGVLQQILPTYTGIDVLFLLSNYLMS